MDKKWIVAEKIGEEDRKKFPELPETVVQLLFNRGLTRQEDIDEFLNPDYGQDIHDPFLFRDMHKVVDRLHQAIARGEKIVVHGDYDADGVSASVILHQTLRDLGATVDVFLPHRDKEGYGLHTKTVDALHEQGTNIIITADCGISNKPEIDHAADYGIDVIVTDHHTQPLKLPDRAFATLHPGVAGETYPFKFLAGGGVAWKLCHALVIADAGKHFPEGYEKWLLDMTAISTVADMVPLLGENRTILKYGLVVLKKTRRPGLRALMTNARVDFQKITADTIGFHIGPRINAEGRLNHSSAAFQLLVESDPARAVELAANVEITNASRRQSTDVIAKEVEEQLAPQKDKEYVLIAKGESWPSGLTGLVSGKYTSQYYKPVIMITKRGEEYVGSGRSISEFNLIEALQSLGEYLEKYGGHPQAAGFTIKRGQEEAFFAALRKKAQEKLAGQELCPQLSLDGALELANIDWPLMDVLNLFAPYGQKNPTPTFACFGVRVTGMRTVGKAHQHLKLELQQGEGKVWPAIAFSNGYHAETLKMGDLIDIAFEVNVNEWNGNRELQLNVLDIHR